MASLMGKKVRVLLGVFFPHTCWGFSPGWVFLMSNKMCILLTLKAFKKLFSGVNSLAMRRAESSHTQCMWKISYLYGSSCE